MFDFFPRTLTRICKSFYLFISNLDMLEPLDARLKVYWSSDWLIFSFVFFLEKKNYTFSLTEVSGNLLGTPC